MRSLDLQVLCSNAEFPKLLLEDKVRLFIENPSRQDGHKSCLWRTEASIRQFIHVLLASMDDGEPVVVGRHHGQRFSNGLPEEGIL